jgi:uncharacterized membrane protein YhaH (DUF805 family)
VSLLRAIGTFFVICATAWTLLSMLVMRLHACGPDKISVAVVGYGIACVQAEKWRTANSEDAE